MSIGEIGVLIPIIGMMIPIVAITTRHKRKMAELEVRRLEARGQDGNDRTEWLEDRVKVLERIVTDKGQNLAAEIEALRDAPPAAPRRLGKGDE
jgi:hypothetical protein